MKVEVYKHEDNWQIIKDAAMFTIGKLKGKYPSSEWKRRVLLAEHSPIREGYFVLRCYDVPSFVIGHIVRHYNGIEKYVQTLRSDRCMYEEVPNRNTPQNIMLHINFQAIINISRKRLCTCASKETREFWHQVLDAIKPYEPELYSVCVKECVYRGFCPEMKSCGFTGLEQFTIERNRYTDFCE